MPTRSCTLDGKPSFKWGEKGTCYTYTPNDEISRSNALKKVYKQAAAIISNNPSEALKMANERIGYDYELSTKKFQLEVLVNIKKGNEVFIVTRRNEKTMGRSVYAMAEKLGIPKDNVYFTNGSLKWEQVMKLQLDLFYDNNQNEIDHINQNTDTKGIKV
jgi:uncharacterized HAD superfamily protein